jgi:hypothetical protein
MATISSASSLKPNRIKKKQKKAQLEAKRKDAKVLQDQ